MKTPPRIPSLPALHLPTQWRLLSAVFIALATPGFAAPPDRLVPSDEILGRTVQTKQNERVGIVCDLLLDLPSGRIVFVAVASDLLFKPSRAVPAEAVKIGDNGALHMNLSFAEWVSTPVVGWNDAWIEEHTDNGLRVRGYYEAPWRGADEALAKSMSFAARLPARPPVVQFVSMQRLFGFGLVSPADRRLGPIAGFLLDWPNRRAAYALVSRDPVELGAHRVARGYAIPLVMLTPPGTTGSVVVNATDEAFARAPMLVANGNAWRRNPVMVFQYAADQPLASARSP